MVMLAVSKEIWFRSRSGVLIDSGRVVFRCGIEQKGRSVREHPGGEQRILRPYVL